MNYFSTKDAAKKLGIHPNTLRRWANEGKIEHIRTLSNQRRYDVDGYLGTQRAAQTICYCRVSSYKQKDDLQRQVDYMLKRFPECEIVKDIGSGINFKRKGLLSILQRASEGAKLKLISAHKDRLCRFGFDLIRWIVENSGGQIMVLNKTDLSPEQELTQDLLTILHVFSCRMHGLRSYKNKIAKDFTNKEAKTVIQKLD